MFTLDGIREFHNWTHASLTRLLDHLVTLLQDSYTTQLIAFGFPTICEQVIHIESGQMPVSFIPRSFFLMRWVSASDGLFRCL